MEICRIFLPRFVIFARDKVGYLRILLSSFIRCSRPTLGVAIVVASTTIRTVSTIAVPILVEVVDVVITFSTITKEVKTLIDGKTERDINPGMEHSRLNGP